jgi:hypothetical protein
MVGLKSEALFMSLYLTAKPSMCEESYIGMLTVELIALYKIRPNSLGLVLTVSYRGCTEIFFLNSKKAVRMDEYEVDFLYMNNSQNKTS